MSRGKAARSQTIFYSRNSRKATSPHPLVNVFGFGQCRKSDDSRGGTVFDLELAQDVFDVLADRSGACAQHHADLVIGFTLGNPTQNLRFARGEAQ